MAGIKGVLFVFIFSLVTGSPGTAYRDRVEAVVNGFPVTGRDVRIELLGGALRGEPDCLELIEGLKGEYARDIPASLADRLLEEIIRKSLILAEIQRARRFRPTLMEREVRQVIESWESALEGNGPLADLARGLAVDRREIERYIRTGLLIDKYVSLEFEVLGSAGKKSQDLYNKWISILRNRAEVVIF